MRLGKIAALSSFAASCGGFGITLATQALLGTVDIKLAAYDPTIDHAAPDFAGHGIYIFWHEYITLPFYLRGHCNLAMLLSQHGDAEWLGHAARYMGFETVRGSSARGSVKALRELERLSRTHSLTITPDGPRGPRRHLAQGPIYLASKLQLPLVLLGFGYSHAWRAPTWDQFAVPWPGARGRVLTSPRIYLPSDLDRDGIEECRQRIETLLNDLTTEAETWAATGLRMEQQLPLTRSPMRLEVRKRLAASLGGRGESEASLLTAVSLCSNPSYSTPRTAMRRAG